MSVSYRGDILERARSGHLPGSPPIVVKISLQMIRSFYISALLFPISVILGVCGDDLPSALDLEGCARSSVLCEVPENPAG